MKRRNGKLYIVLLAALVAAVVLAWVLLRPSASEEPTTPDSSAAPGTFDLDHGVELVKAGRYSGQYVEDGSDEIVQDILAITIKNGGDQDIQLGRVVLTASDGRTFAFDFTTLPAGESLSILESERQAYDPNLKIVSAALNNVALFSQPMSLCGDVFELTLGDGSIGVKNISGKAISGGRVFYKNVSGSALVGGITYMTTVPALAAGEEAVLPAGHFRLSGSRLMFATYAE